MNILKELYPNLPLPPRPVITRWGTWLEAALYYAKHLDKISNVLTMLNSNEAVSIKNAKKVITKPNLNRDLQYTYEYF